jgi:outer membrane lipoprotein carrier protein
VARLPWGAALLAAILAPSIAGAAACSSTQDCLAAIEKAQRETRSMTASFVQVKHLELLDEPIESRGRLSFRRPDRMRLEIQEPVRTTVVIKGREVHVPGLSAKDRQAMAMAPASAMFMQLGAIFTGDTASLTDGFEVSAVAVGDDGIEVTLVPRVEAWRKVFRRMQIEFSGGELSARKVRLDDALGDRLEVTLQDVQRNVELPESLFEVAP